jgi:hypothetical protein
MVLANGGIYRGGEFQITVISVRKLEVGKTAIQLRQN